MKILALSLLALISLPAFAQMAMDHTAQPANATAPERLGTVFFSVSCATAVQVPFNRGVALLHDFWYEEAKRQFEEIAKADPGCADSALGRGHELFSSDMEPSKRERQRSADGQRYRRGSRRRRRPPRERAYIAALSDFYRPEKQEFPERVQAYSNAMGKLYAQYPDDVDAGAFYALSLLAAAPPNDTSLAAEHKAMAVLTPLFAKYPDNPGVVHYIIHSCDNPAMATEGLAASNHYGEIAPSGAHAYHMPGHIYARLGMWPQDIEANLGSVAAAKAAQAKYSSGIMDEPHAYDFLLYAYMQIGQDDRAKWVLDQTATLLTQIGSMPAMSGHRMAGMVALLSQQISGLLRAGNAGLEIGSGA